MALQNGRMLLCLALLLAPLAHAQTCKKLLWFTAIGADTGQPGAIKRYTQMVQAAVLSAKDKAPSLQPHLIYQGEPSAFTEWFQQHGGVVHFWKLSFMDKLEEAVKSGKHLDGWLQQSGAFLRIDIPAILKDYKFPEDIETEVVLYTDCDVMFVSDIDSCTLPKPKIAALGPEFEKGKIANSGVMWINLYQFGKERDGLVAHGVSSGFAGVVDQTLLLEHFKGKLDLVPDKFNYKPYWGKGQDTHIIHFHGLKPGMCLRCLLRAQGQKAAEQECKCSKIYLQIWQNIVPDKGEYYRFCLVKYSRFMKEVVGRPEGGGGGGVAMGHGGGGMGADEDADGGASQRPRKMKKRAGKVGGPGKVGPGGGQGRKMKKKARAGKPMGGRGGGGQGGDNSYADADDIY